MKEKILLDIDGVIANFNLGFSQHLNENLNAGLDLNIEPSEYSIHRWGANLPNETIDNEIPNWVMQGGYLDMPIYPGAKKFVYELMDKYDVYIVTARIGDFSMDLSDEIVNKIKADTFSWFKKHGIPSDKLFFEHKKIDFCHNNNIQTIIEDKLSTVIDSIKSGLRAILVNRGWNQDGSKMLDHPNMHIVYNYNDILKILKT
jgi:5'(3')-deoxyribonucleotidase